MMKTISVSMVALAVLGSSALAQETTTPDAVQQGKRLAVRICSDCHVVARGDVPQPILQPPAPSFESIAQRGTMTADSIRIFLTTTHRDISNPKGMPNPQLVDDQIGRLMAYLLSLQKKP